MSYPGAIISVNHYKFSGGRFTRPEAKAWMEELGWKLKEFHIEDWKLPLTVRCDGTFRDRRSTPDLSNLSKVILDSIEDCTGINDCNMRWEDGDISYGENPSGRIRMNPELEITIKEAR